MIEPSKHQPGPPAHHDAIDVSDFVYAATGARVRRLTMPDGTHWFPAVDVCKRLGHTNTQKALADHVPDGHRESLETLTGGYGLDIPAGREWRRDLNVLSLQGLILLVNACTKPACGPFKQWVAEVIENVQREGSYTLEKAEVQPPGPGAPVAYAMPEQVAEAIVRLEAHNLQTDEELAATQRESLAVQKQLLTTQQELLGTQKDMLGMQQELLRTQKDMLGTQRDMLGLQQAGLLAQQAVAQAMERIANRLDVLSLDRPTPTAAPSARPTAEALLADWRQRLAVS